jgi:hypothetical protein
LARQAKANNHPSFADIERIIGALPTFRHIYRPWWGNQVSNTKLLQIGAALFGDIRTAIPQGPNVDSMFQNGCCAVK